MARKGPARHLAGLRIPVRAGCPVTSALPSPVASCAGLRNACVPLGRPDGRNGAPAIPAVLFERVRNHPAPIVRFPNPGTNL